MTLNIYVYVGTSFIGCWFDDKLTLPLSEVPEEGEGGVQNCSSNDNAHLSRGRLQELLKEAVKRVYPPVLKMSSCQPGLQR